MRGSSFSSTRHTDDGPSLSLPTKYHLSCPFTGLRLLICNDFEFDASPCDNVKHNPPELNRRTSDAHVTVFNNISIAC